MVSAIITTHNRCDLLKQAIKSVLNQTYTDMECIVVDDASSDDTEKEMLKLQEAGLIKYIRIKKEASRGGNHARNVGIKEAKGEYIAFLDDDDEWFPQKIEKQVALLDEEHKVCYCRMQTIYNNGELVTHEGIDENKEGDVSRLILTTIRCWTSGLLVDRHLLMSIGMFDEELKFWQEYELCIRLFQHTKLANTRECLFSYAVNLKDKSRLTNKIEGWKNAVSYIHEKHRNLYAQLTEEERQIVKINIIKDGIMRCSICNDRKNLKKYLWKQFFTTRKFKDLIKAFLVLKPKLRDDYGNKTTLL